MRKVCGEWTSARYVPIGDRGIAEHVKNEGGEKLSVTVTHVTRHVIVELCKYSETFVFLPDLLPPPRAERAEPLCLMPGRGCPWLGLEVRYAILCYAQHREQSLCYALGMSSGWVCLKSVPFSRSPR